MIDRPALEAALGAADAPELLALAGELQGRAWSHVSARTPEDRPPAGNQLLTFGQAAKLLGVSENYVGVLARQRKIPTVRLPGLDRSGRARLGNKCGSGTRICAR